MHEVAPAFQIIPVAKVAGGQMWKETFAASHKGQYDVKTLWPICKELRG